jgi:hypothetical protein
MTKHKLNDEKKNCKHCGDKIHGFQKALHEGCANIRLPSYDDCLYYCVDNSNEKDFEKQCEIIKKCHDYIWQALNGQINE